MTPSEPVLLLSGFMADARLWMGQVPDLSRTRMVSVAPMVGDTLEEISTGILDNAPARFALVGHDLGAAVATDILRRAPERVTRIALICGNAQGETPVGAAAREPRMVAVKTGRFGDVLRQELNASHLHDGPHRSEILSMWYEMALEVGPDAYLRLSRIAQRRPDAQAVLRRARLPALIVAGASDTINPVRRAEFIAQLMPYAELVVIEGAGHLPMWEAPKSLTRALVDWLDTPAPLVLR
ncbi:Pimeloyl-[acyl-carrier protein] methyl ester esterase [Aquimixticola soesokkakensis]|uniref:Pimeloyl-[acyl-carrier protein] methyl ester esterase n=1 Tax=Aquimixticola soesokkakensis TaxID=1519096 RepID=A0A1Y5T1P7_9RHOB|nr:alpha/beta fold hydrolase [Aquimixticola soesokkakensis]SLN50154.1 Pimeloyl-[acyl-carrier protein] methyl ester esterase [Aquimixticola soesokkakensis]